MLPNHLPISTTQVEDPVQKKLPLVLTIDDLLSLDAGDLRRHDGQNSRGSAFSSRPFKGSARRHVPIVFGSGATSAAIPHGKQANQFAYYVKVGYDASQALQTPFLPAAQC